MIDRNLLRTEHDELKRRLATRGVKPTVIDHLVANLTKLSKLKTDLDALRHSRKVISKHSPGEGETYESAAELKKQIKGLEMKVTELDRGVNRILDELPNLPLEEAPAGPDASANRVLREEGKRPAFDFTPRDYLTIAESLDLIDVKRAAKVSGTRFAYLKGQLAELEYALVHFTIEELRGAGFTFIVPPALVKRDVQAGLGYAEKKGHEYRYTVSEDPLTLISTAEHALVPFFSDETLDAAALPKRLLGFSPAFRREAGTYGKDTKGILRVHQFDKLEMVSFATPEQGRGELDALLGFAEGLVKKLDIPYRVVALSTGDLAQPSAFTYDLESWLPGQNGGTGEYRETHSISTCTDYQSRRLKIRCRDRDGKTQLVHTLNGTAFAIGRTLIAIIENYQTRSGGFRVPKALQPFIPFHSVGPTE